jgi:hypothetical protein
MLSILTLNEDLSITTMKIFTCPFMNLKSYLERI